MAKRLPSPPPVLNGFTYVRPLGEGGFADVFLFQQEMPRREVAVKVLLSDLVDADVKRMFNTEADVMARLGSHPAIVTVYEASISADGRPYIAMEYCPAAMTGRYRTEVLTIAEVLNIGVKISGALESAHRSGVLHRDIKPSNVMHTTFGMPVLADFGIAASLAGNANVLAMSVPWSAPEVVEEKTAGTVASEVWALGATLYSLLQGRSPFEVPQGSNKMADISKRVVKAKFTPMDRSDVPSSLLAVIGKAMSPQPADRYSSVELMGQDLQRIEHSLGIQVTPMEVAQGGSAFMAPDINFDDDTFRGPTGSHVPVDSARRMRRGSPIERPDELTGTGAAPARGISMKVALWGGGTLVAVIAGLLTLIIARGI